MSTTFYGPVYYPGGATECQLRSKCVYDVTSSNTAYTISGTVYLQHKGSSVSWGSSTYYHARAGIVSPTNTVPSTGYNTNAYEGNGAYNYATADPIVSTTSKALSALGTHSSWTDIVSKAFTFTVNRTTSAFTAYLIAGECSTTITSTFVTGAAYKSVSISALPSYAVSYNANGGSGAPASQTKYYNQSLTLSSTKPTRANYVFKNWNTASGGTGTTYNPGASYTSNAALTLYAQWYAPYTVTYNANGGTGGPTTQTKVYNTNLTLTTSTPTRSGYAFVKWNTASDGSGTSYSSGATYSANANVTLYAVWAAVPSISSLTAIRCDSNGDQDDEGTYANITCVWSCAASASASGTYTSQSGGGATSFSFTSGASGSGTVTSTGIIGGGNLDTDMQYTVSVTISCTSSGTTKTASRNVILTRAFFVMDWKAGGGAVGIGRAAPASGLEVGYEATFDSKVTALAHIRTLNSNLVRDATCSSSQYSKQFRIADVNDKTVAFFDGGVSTVGSSMARIIAFATDPNDPSSSIYNAFTVTQRSDGTRAYSVSAPAEFRSAIGAVNKAGDTVSGHLYLYNSSAATSMIAKSHNLDIDTTPSANTYIQPIRVQDKDGDEIGHCEWFINTSGELGHNFASVRQKINGTWAWQQCCMKVNKSGTVSYSILAPDNFRSAISAAATTGQTFTGDVKTKSNSIDRDGSNPSSTQWSVAHQCVDKDGENIASYGASKETDGKIRAYLWAYNENSSGSQLANGINLYIDKSNNATYAVTSAANFRSAIGAAASSDRRLKNDISPLGAEAVAFVEDLEPVVYTINGERQVGFVAQDIAAADQWGTNMAFETREGLDGLDDWERMPDGSATWKLDYIRTIPPIAAALKQALRRIDQLEELVSELGGNDAQ